MLELTSKQLLVDYSKVPSFFFLSSLLITVHLYNPVSAEECLWSLDLHHGCQRAALPDGVRE